MKMSPATFVRATEYLPDRPEAGKPHRPSICLVRMMEKKKRVNLQILKVESFFVHGRDDHSVEKVNGDRLAMPQAWNALISQTYSWISLEERELGRRLCLSTRALPHVHATRSYILDLE